jgi:hypothetical protein
MTEPVTYRFVEDQPTTYQFVEPKKIGVAGFPDAVKDTVADFHPLTQMAVGGKALLDMAAYKLKQSFGNKLTPEEELAATGNRALWQESNPAKAGAVMTGIGAYPLAAPFGNFVAARIAPVLPNILAPSLTAATTGAVANLATTPRLQGDPANSTETAVNEGALGGILGDAGARVGARIAQPILQSPKVKALLDKEIVPTMGSSAGGIWRDLEDKATSLPIVGNLIQNARRRSVEEFNRAALTMGTPPGEEIGAVGREAVGLGKSAFGRAYDKVYAGNEIGMSVPLAKDIAAAKGSTIIPLSDDASRQFDQIMKREVFDRLQGGPVPTNQAKLEIEANLGKAAQKADGALRDALVEARNAFRSAMGRSVGPDGAQALTGIDKAYSNFADIKKATQRADAQGGLFTPNQLQRSAKPGVLKTLADDAQGVLPNTVANSGTVDRLLSNVMLTGGAAAGGALPFFGAPYLAAAAASPLIYSRLGQRYMLGDLPGQGVLSSQLRALAPYAAAGGGILRGQQ